MKASFDRQALMARMAELETRVASLESRRPANAAGVADAAQPANDRGAQAAPSRSEAITLVPEKELRASTVGNQSESSRPRRSIYTAAAILIVIGPLLGGAGYLAGGKLLAALQAPPALRKFDPPETMAQAPAAEETADGGPATPAPAGETASAAATGNETAAPEPEGPAVALGVEASTAQPAQAAAVTPPAPIAPSPPAAAVSPPPPPAKAAAAAPRRGRAIIVGPSPAAAVAPPPLARSVAAVDPLAPEAMNRMIRRGRGMIVAAVDPPAPMAAPPTPETPLAKPTKKPKKHTPDKSQDKSEKQELQSTRHAKTNPAKASSTD